MLVLSRKQGQTIVIDDQVTITVLKVKGNCVRLGIDAPEEVSIRRGELEPLSTTDEKHTPRERQNALRDRGVAAEGKCNILLL
jgi:carbon storage regulator